VKPITIKSNKFVAPRMGLPKGPGACDALALALHLL
jgi:hypothetical protein